MYLYIIHTIIFSLLSFLSVLDLLHTYLGISGLTLKGGDDSLSVVFPALNISQRAVDYLHELHKQWDMSR